MKWAGDWPAPHWVMEPEVGLEGGVVWGGA